MMAKFSKVLIVGVFAFFACCILYKTPFSNASKKNPQIRSEVIEVGQGYGYQILIGDKLVVKQEVIPAIHGELPFQSSEDARKVAELVQNKLINRSSPEVSLEELVNLNLFTLHR